MEEFITTGSRSQDAILKGYQTTCRSGIATLLNVDGRTIVACKTLYAEAEEELIKHIKCKNQDIADNIKKYYDPIYKTYYKGFRNWWKNIVHFIKTKFEMYPPVPDLGTIHGGKIWLEKNGVFYASVIKTFQDPEIKDVEMNNFSHSGKQAGVQYINYDYYNETLIPDDIVEIIKEAKDIGLEDIQVAIPSLGDAPQVKDDPYVVGYVSQSNQHTGKESQMFIIAQFGFKEIKPTFKIEEGS